MTMAAARSPPRSSAGTATTWVAAPNAGDYVIKANDGTISSLASWWTGLNVNRGSITPEGFIETSLDLTSFGVVLGCPSTGFHTLNGRSTTGESAKNLVDYFAAQPDQHPVQLRVAVHQEVQG